MDDIAVESRTDSEGNWPDIRFQRASTRPATPTGENPDGWSDGVPIGANTLWASIALKGSTGNLLDEWTTPRQFAREE